MSWVKFTQENVARSRGEREVSEKLRADIEICVRQCANDMVSQFQFINSALRARIQENTDVKHKLETHLQQVCHLSNSQHLAQHSVTLHSLRPMSHLRQSRATLTRDKGSRVKVASVTGRVARCVMACRTVARVVFGIERCSILCECDFVAGVTSV